MKKDRCKKTEDGLSLWLSGTVCAVLEQVGPVFASQSGRIILFNTTSAYVLRLISWTDMRV